MGDDFNAEINVKRQLVLFFVVDTSGSMAGKKIGAVNTAIRELMNDNEFKEAGGVDVDILVAVMSFSNGVKWLTNQPMPVSSMQWNDLEANGATELGAACKELARVLDRKMFISDQSGGLAAPVILLLSDGCPTDNFEGGLAELKANKYYNKSIRFACAIGDDADKEVLAKFCGGKENETVLTVHTPEALRQWIRVVAIKTTKVGGKTKPPTDGNSNTAQEEAVKEVKKLLDNDPDLSNQESYADKWDDKD